MTTDKTASCFENFWPTRDFPTRIVDIAVGLAQAIYEEGMRILGTKSAGRSKESVMVVIPTHFVIVSVMVAAMIAAITGEGNHVQDRGKFP